MMNRFLLFRLCLNIYCHQSHQIRSFRLQKSFQYRRYQNIPANNNYCFEAKIINNEVKLELYNETFQDSDTAKLMILIDFIDILENNQKNVELPIITISNLNELNLFIEDKYMSKNSKKIK